MAKHYEAPAEVRGLEKLINDFTYRNGYNVKTVFDDFLRYIIHGFSPGAPPLASWRYKKEQSQMFWQMLTEWIMIMDRQIKRKEWYDPFGDLYIALTSRSHQQARGQFFTPETICEFMVRILHSDKVQGERVCDPCCGSGRFLLAFHARQPGNYLVAEDIEYSCCLMTVCNFLIHGCVGEVIWHNSLDPDHFLGGWKINETLNQTGIPTIRTITQEEYLISRNRG